MNTPVEPIRVRANLAGGAKLHLWLKARVPAAMASVTLEAGDRSQLLASTAETIEFEFFEVWSELSGWVDIVWDSDALVSYLYAFDPGTVLQTGITPLFIAEDTRTPPLPETYHFRPPLGWMNDPNGFCRVGELHHLFYQHYPHAQVWSAMHWGHATSMNLVDWVHQPVLLLPDPEIGRTHGGSGGALSGSAIPLEEGNGLRVFFTESLPGRVPSTDVQRTAAVPDGIAASPSFILIDRAPDGLDLGSDFRDPYVFKGPDGRYRMVVGSSDEEGGVVLLFETDDPTGSAGWAFAAVLHRDGRAATRCAECVCLVPVGGEYDDPDTLWALIYGQLKSADYVDGPRHPTTAIVGRFDGKQFAPSFERDLDFLAGSYGFQAFADGGFPLGIAWLADWSDWDKSSKFPTSMTVPRRLLLADDGKALLTAPVEALTQLRRTKLDEARLASGGWVSLANGAAELHVVLAEPGASFLLELGHPTTKFSIATSNEGIQLLLDVGSGAKRHVASGARPSDVRVFIDRGSIEIFADNGRWTGTKRLHSLEPFTSVRLTAAEGAVAGAQGWNLASSTSADDRNPVDARQLRPANENDFLASSPPLDTTM
jgi:beta-fructofuranosidase